MLGYVTGVVARICAAGDREELTSAIQLSLADLDLTTFNLSCNKQSKSQFMTEPTLSTWSGVELEKYISAQWFERDPLLEYATSYGDAKVWTLEDWRKFEDFGGYADFLEKNNVCSVVVVPLPGTPVTLSAIAATSDQPKAVSKDTVSAVQIIGQIGMLRAQVLGLVDTPPNDASRDLIATLSDDQIEILNWAQQGKTNGEIALITGRSKRTVAYHISEILRKLGVTTRAQAIAMYAGQ